MNREGLVFLFFLLFLLVNSCYLPLKGMKREYLQGLDMSIDMPQQKPQHMPTAKVDFECCIKKNFYFECLQKIRRTTDTISHSSFERRSIFDASS